MAREMGMRTAVTTRKGQIDATHADCSTELTLFSQRRLSGPAPRQGDVVGHAVPTLERLGPGHRHK